MAFVSWPCAKHWAKHFIYITTFNSQNNPLRQGLLLSSNYRWDKSPFLQWLSHYSHKCNEYCQLNIQGRITQVWAPWCTLDTRTDPQAGFSPHLNLSGLRLELQRTPPVPVEKFLLDALGHRSYSLLFILSKTNKIPL